MSPSTTTRSSLPDFDRFYEVCRDFVATDLLSFAKRLEDRLRADSANLHPILTQDLHLIVTHPG